MAEAELSNGWMSDREVVLAFANSHGFGRGPDRLIDGAGLQGWLDELGWLGTASRESQVTDADAAEARELRDALLVALLSNSRDPQIGVQQVQAAEALLRRAGERYPLRSEIDGGDFQLRPARTGTAGALGQVLASVMTLSLSGQWSRVKACRNQPCHRAFFDHSRNTSAGYCRPQCGSAASMRLYRARRSAAAEAAGPER